MQSEGEKTNNPEKRITAEELRQSIALKQAAKVDEALKKRSEADRELERFFLEFMESQISQEEIDQIRQKVLNASERSEFEVEVLRFPAKLGWPAFSCRHAYDDDLSMTGLSWGPASRSGGEIDR